MKRLKISAFFLVLLASISPIFAQNPTQTTLDGGGATFPYPLYQKMFQSYKGQANIAIKYTPVGSGKGYQNLKSETFQFSATDMFFDSKLLADLPRPVIHVPICLGSVAVAYNLPGNPELQLNSEILSGIFLGKIRKWNDPKIQFANPSIILPDSYIVPIFRGNASGTTYIFSEFLTKTNSEWKETFGITPTLENASGIASESSIESAKMIQQIPGSITYQELSYCLANNQSIAKIQNMKGQYVKPSYNSVSLAGNTNMPLDGRISITNTDNFEGYPIASFSWIVLYKDQNYNQQTKSQAQELVKLVWWMTHDGQKLVEESGYAPLHKKTIQSIEQSLKSVTYGGKPILD